MGGEKPAAAGRGEGSLGGGGVGSGPDGCGRANGAGAGPDGDASGVGDRGVFAADVVVREGRFGVVRGAPQPEADDISALPGGRGIEGDVDGGGGGGCCGGGGDRGGVEGDASAFSGGPVLGAEFETLRGKGVGWAVNNETF